RVKYIREINRSNPTSLHANHCTASALLKEFTGTIAKVTDVFTVKGYGRGTSKFIADILVNDSYFNTP
ncbi:MAG: hypothetical protein V1709_01635, partial [Planctomycetota bacterium]